MTDYKQLYEASLKLIEHQEALISQLRARENRPYMPAMPRYPGVWEPHRGVFETYSLNLGPVTCDGAGA